ncbi:hypothetical protein POUND7_009450 [Theobroma cacao]
MLLILVIASKGFAVGSFLMCSHLIRLQVQKLCKEDKDNLRILVETQKHKFVTPEIIRELDNSRNRGEEDDLILMDILFSSSSKYLSFLDLMLPSPISVINKAIEEDRFDIPDVPMEED